MEYDVVIIGAGFSGLAAAVRLAHFGRRVCVVERHTVWGGLNSFYKKGGHLIDTGLHALTNYIDHAYRGPRVPLQRICRQLRLPLEALELEPQSFSEIRFGDARLRFSNDLRLLAEEIRAHFPDQIDAFRRLIAACEQYPDVGQEAPFVSGRRVLRDFIPDPLLREMLLAPLLFYGSAHENDIDFDQLIVLFKSIYEEGFCRPRGGTKHLIDLLVSKLDAQGVEIRRGDGVARIEVEDRRVRSLVLESGDVLTADIVLSSAGLAETTRLRSDAPPDACESMTGQLGFMETIWVLDQPPRALGHEACITFFNAGPVLAYAPPEALADVRSGVICCPTNYGDGTGHGEPTIRATHLASWRRWFAADEGERWQGATLRPRSRARSPARTERYLAEKAAWVERSREAISRYVGDFRPHVVFTDAFTPSTVAHFTSKIHGAIYGARKKVKSGRTDLENLFLCGTDQGMVGIVGAMLSGINAANFHGLAAAAEPPARRSRAS